MIDIARLRTLTPTTIALGTHPGIIQSMLDYEYMCGHDKPSIVAIITKGRKQERYFWGENEIEIPVLPSLDSLPAETLSSINCVINTLSARRVLASTSDAMIKLPNLQLVAIFAEQVPERHSIELAKKAKEHEVLVVGPASVGILVPNTIKLGAIGGTQHPQLSTANIMAGGDTSVISTSGGMVNELIHAVTGSGLRIAFALALGGDRFPITTPAEAFLLAERDSKTKRIVYFGELGGSDEYEIIELIKAGKITKPIIAYVAGVVAEVFETPPQFGHAKAMAQSYDETAAAKKKALREAGATVIDSLGELTPLLKSYATDNTNDTQARAIGERHKHLMVSHISGDVKGDIQLLGKGLRETVESNSLAGLTISLLLGKQIESQKLIDFTDYVLRLLADHGPYVSGAANTIVTARAGKDLVSSLTAGLLTIGPRFGGAINQAANSWLRGAAEGESAKDFVASFTAQGGIIQGIGHKKYRIDLPDPRVAALKQFSNNANGDKYLNFALEVQAVTTAKKGNLILNVDGAIAAILLDILESELQYSREQLQELIDIEFFNALFVLSRSIGFTAHYLDQKRHDEGLFRFSDREIAYIPESTK